MNTTFKPADHVAKVVDQAATAIGQTSGKATVASAEIAKAIKVTVDAYAKANNVSPHDAFRLMEAVAANLPKSQHSAAVAKYAAELGIARTQFRDAAAEEALLHRTLHSFRPADFESVADASPATFGATARALAPLASVIGTVLGHNTWHMLSVGKMVEGADAANIDGTRFDARPYMMPMEAILEREADSDKKPLLAQVLGKTRRGIVASLGGLSAQEVSAAQLFAGREVRALLHRVGDEMRQVWQLHRADPNATIDWKKLPRAYQVLKSLQEGWVAEQRALPASEQRYKDLMTFDALPARTQIRNVPVAVAALDGMLNAIHFVDLLEKHGTFAAGGATGDADTMLHVFLATGAHQALAEPHFDTANDYHAQVVALQATLGMLAGPEEHRESVAAAANKVNGVFEKAAREAGKLFDPALANAKAASDAPKVAFRHAAEALGYLQPEAGLSSEEWDAKIRDVLDRATVDDIAQITTEVFDRKAVDESGAELHGALVKLNGDLKDSYFADAVKGLPFADGKKKPLDAAERQVLEVLLRMANITWMAGQVHRARGDGTRVDPFKRAGVYQPYHLLARLGSTLEAIYVVAKDLHEMRKAAGLNG